MSLSGQHLKVAADVWVPWVDLQEDRGSPGLKASGVAAKFFNTVAMKLNFTYTLVMPEDREWGRGMPNGSFTGMIGQCQRKEVDMALGPFGVTWERAQVVDFSSTLYVDGFGIFLPRPRLERDLAGFLKPLAWQVWLVLAASLGLSILLSSIYNCVHDGRFLPASLMASHFTIHDSLPVWEFRHVWLARAILRQPITSLPWDAAARTFLGTWLVATIVLSTAYQGVLTSLLAVPTVTVPVDSLEDLVSHGKIPWANERGTSLHQLFSEAKSGLYKKVGDGGSLVVNVYQARHRVKEERMAVLCDFFTMRKIMSEDFGSTGQCHYYIAEEPIKAAPLAFAFPKGSPLLPHFNKWVQILCRMAPLKESGLVSRSVQELTANATACLVPPGQEAGLGGSSSLLLTLPDLAGVFLLFTAGMAMASLVLALETFFN